MSKGEYLVRAVAALAIVIAFAVAGLYLHEFWCLMLAFILAGVTIIFIIVGGNNGRKDK